MSLFSGYTVNVLMPSTQRVPFVFASPHSGSTYPPDFIHLSALDLLNLRRSEDIYINKIFSRVVDFGAPLLQAIFPRALLDPNREPYELNQTMFEDSIPSYVNTDSCQAISGFGTIPKVVSDGFNIYTKKLRFVEAEYRMRAFYGPYHQNLERLVAATRHKFGYCITVDCHSMPSSKYNNFTDKKVQKQFDFILGDCFGTSCARFLINTVEYALTERGYQVKRNIPYSGGHTIRLYGHPNRCLHALQIEINRRLYVNEDTYAPLPGLENLQDVIESVVSILLRISKKYSRSLL